LISKSETQPNRSNRGTRGTAQKLADRIEWRPYGRTFSVTKLNAPKAHRFLRSLPLISLSKHKLKEQRVIKNYAEDEYIWTFEWGRSVSLSEYCFHIIFNNQYVRQIFNRTLDTNNMIIAHIIVSLFFNPYFRVLIICFPRFVLNDRNWFKRVFKLSAVLLTIG